MRHFRWALSLGAVLLFASIPMFADVELPVYSGPAFQVFPGNSTTITTASGDHYTITAYYWHNGAWDGTGVNLIGRNDPGGTFSPDHGLGICNPDERALTVNNGSCPVNGNYNEISNRPTPELLQISKDFSGNWTGLGVSSLDNNLDEQASGLDDFVERGQIFGSSLDVSALAFGTLFDNTSANLRLLCDFTISGNKTPSTCSYPLQVNEPFITFAGSGDPGTYLYLQGYEPSSSTFLNNDYLLRSLPDTAPTPPPVPEPSSLMLLATGLGAASLAAKKFRG